MHSYQTCFKMLPPPPNFIVNSFLHRDLAEFYLRQKLNPQRRNYIPSKQIPKIIHYAWFGSAAMPAICQQCIDSWHKIHPDWEFMLWNESNFPFDLYPYAKEALEKKCWAFISDVARLHAVYYHGGVYLDTDVKTIKSFNNLLNLGKLFKNPRAKPDGTKMFCSAFLNDARMCCFFANAIVKY